MTLAELRTDVGLLVGSDRAGVDAEINSALRIFAFLTLSVEATATLASAAWLDLGVTSIAVLRIRDAAGVALRRKSLQQIESAVPTWRTATGAPLFWAPMGPRRAIIAPADGSTLTIDYATFAPALVGDGESPAIPTHLHHLISKGAAALIRQVRDGAQEGAKTDQYIDEFVNGVVEVAARTRERALARGFEVAPVEMSAKTIKQMLSSRKAAR